MFLNEKDLILKDFGEKSNAHRNENKTSDFEKEAL